MKTHFQDYFYYSKTQRNGLLILICLIMLTYFLSSILSDYLVKPSTDFSEFEEEVIAFEGEMKGLDKNTFEESISKERTQSALLFSFDPNTITKEELIKLGIKPTVAKTFIKYRNTGAKFYKKNDIKKVYGITETEYARLAPYIQFKQKRSKPKENLLLKTSKQQPLPKQIMPFAFNPNKASKETLLNLGLSEKVAQTVINFRSKGGQFWKKQDFKKIYGLTEKEYSTLEPYIEIAPKKQAITENRKLPKDIPQSFSTTTAIKVDINKGRVEDWKQLRGIGEATAKRIVNFRDKLGGFESIEQIKMTYNVPDSVIDKISTQLIISPIPSKIPINSISAKDLSLHPYIKTKQAYTIINYRTNHGSYQSIEDLTKVKSLKPEFIERIRPYLSFGDKEAMKD